MSRADPPIPDAPRLGSTLRVAAVDFYYHSIRLVAANLVWGLAFLAVFGIGLGVAPLAGVVLAPLLAVPWVGVSRLAALIVRGDDVVLGDAFEAYGTWLRPALAGGAAVIIAGLVFVTNVGLGLQAGGVAGWSLATLAAWGLLGTWIVSLSFWPLLVDPRRADVGALTKLRLAVLLVLAFPARLAALGVVMAIAAAASTVAAAAILTISVSYIALATTRYVLPAADRLAARLETPESAAPPSEDLARS